MTTRRVVLALLLSVCAASASAAGGEASFFVDLGALRSVALEGAASFAVSAASATRSKDVVYVQDSVEYAAACVQAYRLGWEAVRTTAAVQTGDWAVVLDVDETVLDNSQYEVESATAGFTLETWNAWVERKEARAVPGAKEFLDAVRASGPQAHVAFITDRRDSQAAATIENLRAVGLWRDGDLMLAKAGKTDTKDVRRACVALGSAGTDARCASRPPMNIVAQFGDSLRDFYELYGAEAGAAARAAIESDPRWGVQFFILPNPMYGQWERGYK